MTTNQTNQPDYRKLTRTRNSCCTAAAHINMLPFSMRIYHLEVIINMVLDDTTGPERAGLLSDLAKFLEKIDRQ